MSNFPFTVKDVIRMLKEDAILMQSWMAERVHLGQPLDYRFFHQFFELLAIRLQWLEDLL